MSLPPDVYDLPPELCCKSQPLIGLTGLDTLNNAIHRTIWDAFTNNRRPDKTSVQYKILNPDHEFPVTKPKRNSYEWYIPKGILKRNWMDKYVNQVPSVVVIFYDLEWDDAFWNEKKLECASRVQSVRASLEGRSTRIAVVLVQHMPTLPAGEDATTAERAASLCSTCELNAKSLFLLPHSDHLQGYTLRLENAFYELGQSFYHQKVRSIRAHRDHLNKTTHQYLFVRHQFKMAFLNELKQDPTVAIKHYTQAYNHLLDVRMVDTNALEIKTIASFTNYKLCQLAFSLNLPRDAISQFRKHIEIFRPISGSKDVAFEHHAWLAKQYCMFGELFDEAIHQGLPAVQTQHPGIYFQLAAQHASDRKQACLDLCKDGTVYPHPDPLDGAEDLEFFGQRPWRPGKLSAEPADMMKEKEAIQALQYKEKHTANHSMLIIALLGSAISQAKTYRCPRTRRQLVVQMAEEYYSAKDYSKALTLLSHMLWEYRSERWSLLLTHVLLRALDCAFLSASVQEFVALGVEAQGSHVTLSAQQKAVIFDNVNRVLRGVPPTTPEGVKEDQGVSISQWKAALASSGLPKPLSVDMNNVTSFLETKARFCDSCYEADKRLQIEVLVRSRWVSSVQMSRIAVVVSSPSSSAELEARGPSLSLQQNDVKRFECSFKCKPEDIGKEVQISAVHLYVGTDIEHSVLLRFAGSSDTSTSSNCQELQHFRPCPLNMPDFDGMRAQLTAQVVARESRLEVDTQLEAPALLGEWLPICVELHNAEASEAKSLVLEVNFQQQVGEQQDQATHLCIDPSLDPGQLPLKLTAAELKPGEKCELSFYLKSHRLGQRQISLKVLYSINSTSLCEKESCLQVEVVKPFDATAKFFSQKFDPITKAFTQEPFIVMPELKCLSPWPLYIETTCLELSSQVQSADKEMSSQLASTALKQEEVGTEAFCVLAAVPSEQPVSVGMYTVRWQRQSSPKGQITSSSISLPALLRVDPSPLFVDLELPAHGWVGSPMAAWYRVHNRTNKLLEVELSLQASDAFMFAGHKQLRLKLMPDAVHTLSYNLYPLLSGLVALPQLRLTPTDGSTDLRANQLLELLERSLPTHIYVMPQAKGKPDTRSS